ncbi:putative ATP-grasp-modified RiPP [Actinokineospora sp.]|uniref:putative ATP-grasp-modified RiPP n=1 Tax=Actinokineospora sp. TaxID=1872133 RepID=UPI004037BB43
MSTAVMERFADDPVASHSAQVPLGRISGQPDTSAPSPAGLRPWGLSAMRPARHQGDPVREIFTYDHDLQVAVTGDGVPLTITAATANKVTNNDGDEGPSEDFTYDYCPDSPNTV